MANFILPITSILTIVSSKKNHWRLENRIWIKRNSLNWIESDFDLRFVRRSDIFLWWWCNYREFIMLLVYFRKSNKQTPLRIPIIASIGSWLKFNFCLDIFGRMLLFNKISGCCSRALCFGLKSRFLTRVRAWFEKNYSFHNRNASQ